MLRLCFALVIAGFPPAVLVAGETAGAGADREQRFLTYLGSPSRVKGGAVKAHWLADGRRFWYAAEAKDGPTLFLVDPRADTRKPLFDAARLRRALADKLGGSAPRPAGLTFAEADNQVRFTCGGKAWRLALPGHTLSEAPPAEKAKDRPRLVRKGALVGEPTTTELASPDGRRFATERDHNLALRRADSDEVMPLTEGGVEGHAWGVRNAAWSPTGAKLAAFKTDTRQVPRYPVVRWLTPGLEVERVPLTRPGGEIPRQELFLIDVRTKRAVPVRAGPARDHSLAIVRWLPDGSELWFVRVDREYKKLELLAADAATGAVRPVLAETQKTFVQVPLLAEYDLPLLAGGRQFLWLSERTGWNHIYLYGRDGRLLRPLTRGEFPVVRVVGVDEACGWVYFTAHGDRTRPYDTHLYRVSLKGGEPARLTEAEGQHDYPAYLAALGGAGPVGAQFSPSWEYFLDMHSNTDRPPRVELRRADGRLVRVLEEADAAGLKGIGWAPPEPFVVKADDGRTDLHGLLYKPRDFDPARKYPVLDYIYNGPQTTWVARTFNGPGGLLPQAMAQLGYVVLVVDGRGTPERGKAFQDVVHGHFGGHEVPDHVAALKQLAARRPYLDLGRVGVFGGSFGGYMTVRAMLTAPDVYRVGVAMAPIYAMEDAPAFIEMYMGLPEHNRKGYEAASCLRLASRLRGKLLILHGTSDVNAPFAATMRMADAFARAGKRVDMQILPEQTHAPAGPYQLYWINAARAYLQEHLRP